ncbi:hypothetical protein F511_45044 [Dorcoceras hygrometricum]|uniref:Uncharacterized protein n=1 Tax=Dorcoceras hygrometricum TaxID=472368 RepID=A0A2Z6ZWW5_9LAMI|nr:hypothetical protein F511_45044 [Dorcoceras hygrometricum]
MKITVQKTGTRKVVPKADRIPQYTLWCTVRLPLIWDTLPSPVGDNREISSGYQAQGYQYTQYQYKVLFN